MKTSLLSAVALISLTLVGAAHAFPDESRFIRGKGGKYTDTSCNQARHEVRKHNYQHKVAVREGNKLGGAIHGTLYERNVYRVVKNCN